MGITDRVAATSEERLLAHWETPYHRGRLTGAVWTQSLRNPLCGDEITLDVDFQDGRVTAARFDGRGCVVSQAAASVLCEEIEGRSLEELFAMWPQEMLDLVGVRLSPVRQQCALLAFRCLQRALAMPHSVDHPGC